MSLPATVQFNTVALTIHDHDGQPWLAARDLAHALWYEDASAVGRLYARHSDEFTQEMTATVNLTVGVTPVDIRIFSPRGCHLIAMLARTPAALPGGAA